MDETTGRSESFLNGAYAQTPAAHFHSLQQGAGAGGFKPLSVLDQNQVFKSPNGMSAADRARQPLSGQGQSLNGQSSTTYNDRMMIGRQATYSNFG